MLKLAEYNTAKKLGIKIGITIQEFLQLFQYKTNHKNDLFAKHNIYLNGIDHLIMMPNKVICIQNRLNNHTACKDTISNFVSAILICKKMFPNLEIICVFISKYKISEAIKNTLLSYSKICYFIEFLSFNELFRLLKYIMHLHNNFMINDNDETIMLDNYDCEEIILYYSNKITL